MNLQLKPRTDSVLQHPHLLCALHDPRTRRLRLKTRSGDLAKLIGGDQLPVQKLSEHHNTRILDRHKQLKPIQLP
jgi:hypothetical protein